MTSGLNLRRALDCICDNLASLAKARYAVVYSLATDPPRVLAQSANASVAPEVTAWVQGLGKALPVPAMDHASPEAFTSQTIPADSAFDFCFPETAALPFCGMQLRAAPGYVLVLLGPPAPVNGVATPTIPNATAVAELLALALWLADGQSSKESEREHDLADYLLSLVHDLNNQFAVVLGHVYLLSENPGDLASIRDSAKVIREAVLAANSLISPLLRSAHQVDDGETAISLDAWLQQELPAIVQQVDSEVVFEFSPGAASAIVQVSGSRLRRTIRLLLARMREVVPENTHLRLWTEFPGSELPPLAGQVDDEGSPIVRATVRIGITSTGTSAHPAETVNEASAVNSAPGRPLPDFAIPVAQHFARRYGGEFSVSDHPDGGRSAALTLPVLRDRAAAEDPGLPLESSDVATTSGEAAPLVFVIDDDQNIRNFIEHTLTDRGYQVLCCSTSQEAVNRLQRGPAPDAIVCDVVLPDGSGPQLCDRLSGSIPPERWLFMSGYGGQSLIDRQLLGASSPFLSKPFTPDDLATKLLEVLLGDQSASQRTVLVVEDEAGIRELLRQVLTSAGYRVLQAKDGNEALQLLSGQPVDLLLTDLLMPSLDGASLIEQARYLRPNLPMIAFTGSAAAEARLAAAMASGATEVLKKPIEAQELLQVVARNLRWD
jgi:CheY-like chemotaxis protein